MSTTNSDSAQTLVLVTAADGVSLIQTGTPLTRLNYFDGKFLRAADLQAEQRYLRELVKAGNRAGGSGVVHGLELRLTGDDEILVSPGLAIDGTGQAILVSREQSHSVSALIEASRGLTAADAGTATGDTAGCFDACAESAAETTTAVPAYSWYLITVAYAEALCGEEDVYGALCEQACVTTTDRPLRVEGALLRARPLIIDSELAASGFVTLRSALASAYFADEAARHGCPISATTLRSSVWCAGAAAGQGSEVPLGVLVREGAVSRFVDLWTARREHIDSPPKRYWQWCMGMRPWNVFLAQVLQFQCQLRDVLAGQPGGGSAGPCDEAQSLVGEAAIQMGAVSAFYQALITGVGGLSASALARLLAAMQAQGLSISPDALAALHQRLAAADAAYQALPANGQLVHLGIVELPSAGYLPVSPSDTLSVNEQVRRLLGDGVDLSFCTCRPDFVAHALEEAQHLERIPLLEGLKHSERRPQVDILVPNGETLREAAVAPGQWFSVRAVEIEAAGSQTEGVVDGVGRGEVLPGGGATFAFAGWDEAMAQSRLARFALDGDMAVIDGVTRNPSTLLNAIETRPSTDAPTASEHRVSFLMPRLRLVWAEGICDRDPFMMPVGGVANVTLGFRYLVSDASLSVRGLDVPGKLRVVASDRQGQGQHVKCTFDGQMPTWGLTDGVFGPPEPYEIAGTVTLDSTPAAAGGRHFALEATIERIVPGPSSLKPRSRTFEIRVQVAWAGSPTLATGEYHGLLFSRDRTISAQADPSIGDDGSEAHRLAVLAIERLAKAMNDTLFADMALSQLFPPPPESTEGLVVRAVRGWVLFHRRREKSCATIPPVPIAVPPRTYALYRIVVQSEDALEALAVAARSAQDLSAYVSEEIGTLSFEADRPTPVEIPDEILDGWPPDALLAFGAIAQVSESAEAGSDILARLRLSRVVQSLVSVSVPNSQVTQFLLQALPPPLDAGDADGVILLGALRIQTLCHRLFRLESDEQDASFGRLEKYLADANADLGAILINDGANPLGVDAIFRVGTDDLMGADGAAAIATSWDSAGGGPVTAALIGAQQAVESEQGLVAQGQAVASAAGGEQGVSVDIARTLRALADCQVYTILLSPPPALMDVYVVLLAQLASSATELMSSLEDAGLSSDLLAVWESGDLKLGSVHFDGADNPSEADLSVLAANEALTRMREDALEQGIDLTIEPAVLTPLAARDRPERIERAKRQGQLVSQRLNVTGEVVDGTNGSTTWPASGATALLLICVSIDSG